MRTLRLLVACAAMFGMVFAAGCGDDDGADTETNCTDGLDNDGDNAIDCLDSDCHGNAACPCNFNTLCEDVLGENANNCSDCAGVCGNDVCEADEDATSCPADCDTTPECGNDICEAGEDATSCPADCSGGEQCLTDADVLADVGCTTGETCDLTGSGVMCRPIGTVADYAACAAPTDCAANTVCFPVDGSTTLCTPYCDIQSGTGTCPGAGQCSAYIVDHDSLGLCVVPVNNCDPVANTDCTAPDVCYFAPTGADCRPESANAAQPGSPCDPAATASEASCVAGSSCINDGNGLNCYEVCTHADGVGCDSGGTCQNAISDATFGICM